MVILEINKKNTSTYFYVFQKNFDHLLFQRPPQIYITTVVAHTGHATILNRRIQAKRGLSRLVRSNENSAERNNNRLLQNQYSAMNYDFIIDYKNDPMVILCQLLKSKAGFIIWLAVYYRIDMTNTYFCRYTSGVYHGEDFYHKSLDKNRIFFHTSRGVHNPQQVDCLPDNQGSRSLCTVRHLKCETRTLSTVCN
ncbi:ATP-dependent DNA helicase [Aphis craccivora]|uniref:ATP-dependent DNA helicase n=1 Tax=Aphis craccivora TaxID=307492 RepID=A0A6G0ZF18_APHCR|nr:ATP-dependent DNA helicase [Aphis craccivora]